MEQPPEKSDDTIASAEPPNEAEKSAPDRPQRFGWRYYLKWVERIGKVFGVISVLGTVIVYLLAGRDYDIDIWLEKVNHLYPSDDTADIELPLSYEGDVAKSITFIDLNVSNPGKTPIGVQTEPWTLTLMGPPQANVIVLKVSRGGKSITKWSINPNPNKNAASLQIGLLQPHEYLHIYIMLVNVPKREHLNLIATTSLQGLRDPKINDLSPFDREVYRIIPIFMALFIVVAVLAIFIQEYRTVGRWRYSIAQSIGYLVILIPLMAAFYSYFFAYAVVWVFTRAQNIAL
jgi:hypothetical protein